MFLVRPVPKPQEHLLAYILRVSWLNHLRCLQDLLCVCGLNTLNNRIAHRKLVSGKFQLAALARWLNMDASFLGEKAINVAAKSSMYFGHLLPSDMLDFSAPSFCLECLNTSGYIYAIGALKPMSYCPKHRTCYISHWDNGESLKWGDSNFWQRVYNQPSTERAPLAGEVELNEIIHHLWRGDNITGLDGPLHLMTLKDLLLLLRFVMKFHPELSQAKSRQSLPNRIWVEAFDFLQEWPLRIQRLFRYYEHNPMCSSHGNGVRATYRDLYDELYSGPHSNSYAYLALQKAFEAFVNRSDSATPLWSPNHKLIACDAVNWITFTAILKALGIREKGLTRLIELKLLTPTGTTATGMALFERAQVDRFVQLFSSLINLTGLCDLLKVSRSVARQLAEIGFLSFIDCPSDKWRDWIFDVETITETVNGLKEQANVISKPGMQMPKAPLRFSHFHSQTSSEVLMNMLLGKLPYKYIPDIKNTLSLQQFHPIQQDIAEPSVEGFITPNQAAKTLGVNINAIYGLIGRGFIKVKKLKVPSHTRRISLVRSHSLRLFQKHFILKPISKRHLVCISGPKIDGGIVNIYQRKQGGFDD